MYCAPTQDESGGQAPGGLGTGKMVSAWAAGQNRGGAEYLRRKMSEAQALNSDNRKRYASYSR
jgi:hypothetical protein